MLTIPNSNTGVQSLITYLTHQGIPPAKLVEAKEISTSKSIFFEDALLQLGIINEDTLLKALSKTEGYEIANPRTNPGDNPRTLAEVMNPSQIKLYDIAPYRKEGGKITFILPYHARRKTGLVTASLRLMGKLEFVLTTTEQFREYQALFNSGMADADIEEIQSRVTKVKEPTLEENSSAPLRVVASIFEIAAANRASDIHIQAKGDKAWIRFRIDGELTEFPSLQPPLSVLNTIITTIKVAAGLDAGVSRSPQDASLTKNGVTYRLALLPMVVGTNANMPSLVLRALPTEIKSVNELGIPDDIGTQLRRLAHLPNGLILVTGPTGSGKSSTIFSLLKEIATPNRKVITIENPVEYRLEGATQIQVNEAAGNDFATIQRTLLRSDPDIVLIGEIRDDITARTAIQASQTGHLVFATLHTNSSIDSLTRLENMSIERYLIADTVRGILAQRLLRTLCSCATDVETPPTFKNLIGPRMKKPVGCSECLNSGYKGRRGVYELLTMTKDFVAAYNNNSPKEALLKIAQQNGMRTLLQQGLDLVKSGHTTLQEVFTKIME